VPELVLPPHLPELQSKLPQHSPLDVQEAPELLQVLVLLPHLPEMQSKLPQHSPLDVQEAPELLQVSPLPQIPELQSRAPQHSALDEQEAPELLQPPLPLVAPVPSVQRGSAHTPSVQIRPLWQSESV